MLLDGKVLDARNPAEILRRIGGASGQDARLTDARVPLAHTHVLAELSDYVAYALPTALAQMEQHLVVDNSGALVIQTGGAPVFANP